MFFLSDSFLFNSFQSHSYHLVTKSPWPFLCAISTLLITVGAVMTFNFYEKGFILLVSGVTTLLGSMFFWWLDVTKESTWLGYHTYKVIGGLKVGMLLFMISEIMFFLSFFWTFFHTSLVPHFVLGSTWPPVGVNILSPLQMPFLNTIILLTSGFTVTVCHYGLCSNSSLMNYKFVSLDSLMEKINEFFEYMNGCCCSQVSVIFLYMHTYLMDLPMWQFSGFYYSLFEQVFIFLFMTVFLALEFTLLQALEYFEAVFYVNDNMYGSTFYLTTGFHGLHVLMGTFFLVVCLFRLFWGHFLPKHHSGLEFAIWYWHFVDVVWLFLFVMVYVWGAGTNF